MSTLSRGFKVRLAFFELAYICQRLEVEHGVQAQNSKIPLLVMVAE